MTDGPTPPEKDLQIEQDLPFQRREMLVSRAAWVAMLLILLAGLAGLLGSGPYTETTSGAPGSALWIKHHRVARWETPTPLHVHLGPGRPSPLVAVWIRQRSPEGHDIARVDPPPLFVEAHPDRLQYVFYAPDTASEIAITFTLQPDGWGHREGPSASRAAPRCPSPRSCSPDREPSPRTEQPWTPSFEVAHPGRCSSLSLLRAIPPLPNRSLTLAQGGATTMTAETATSGCGAEHRCRDSAGRRRYRERQRAPVSRRGRSILIDRSARSSVFGGTPGLRETRFSARCRPLRRFQEGRGRASWSWPRNARDPPFAGHGE